MIDRREFLQTTAAGTAVLYLSPMSLGAAQPQAPVTQPDFEQPFRQIHLDFHTSRFIENVGAEFDPDEFAETLKRAHVNSINCFGRCHHGFIYWDTQAFKDKRHPHLTRPLLNEQIETPIQDGKVLLQLKPLVVHRELHTERKRVLGAGISALLCELVKGTEAIAAPA